jgi:hypothetical protein
MTVPIPSLQSAEEVQRDEEEFNAEFRIVDRIGVRVGQTSTPGTVRRHLQNAYPKLGVHTRTAAAARMRQPSR